MKPRVIVTAGATAEPLDPVRVITNRSSGKQGVLIAEALADAGAEISLILGTASVLPAPAYQGRMEVIRVETAEEMLRAVLFAAPAADALVMCAAVCDWRPLYHNVKKMKKTDGEERLTLEFIKNPDILHTLCADPLRRPRLTAGFAAETAESPEELLRLARAKHARKGCDWLIANNVSPHPAGESVFGGDEAKDVYWLDETGVAEAWGSMSKQRLAAQLAARVARKLAVFSAATCLAFSLGLSACKSSEGGKSMAEMLRFRKPAEAEKPAESAEFERIAALKVGQSADFGGGRFVKARKRYTSLGGDECVLAEIGSYSEPLKSESKPASAEGKGKPEAARKSAAAAITEDPLPPEGGVMPAEVKKETLPPPAPPADDVKLKLLCRHGRWAVVPLYRRFDEEERP